VVARCHSCLRVWFVVFCHEPKCVSRRESFCSGLPK
jgi:hypothetical protein